MKVGALGAGDGEWAQRPFADVRVMTARFSNIIGTRPERRSGMTAPVPLQAMCTMSTSAVFLTSSPPRRWAVPGLVERTQSATYVRRRI